MHISIGRSERAIPGTHFRPIEQVAHKSFMEHEVHRRIDLDDYPDVIRKHPRRVALDEIDLILASGNAAYAPASLEDSYNRGRFVGGYVYVRALAAFLHEDFAANHEADNFTGLKGRIGVGAVVGAGVQLGEQAQIGAFVEAQKGAQIMDGAQVGDNAVIRKGARIGTDAVVGANSYVGQFALMNHAAQLGTFGVLQHSVTMSPGSIAGTQTSIGRETYLGSDAYIGDSVTLGRSGYAGPHVVVGEMAHIGDNFHVGENSSIGAESRLGSLVRVAKNVMLVSPTYAEDGAFITTSNLFAGPPQSEE